jgi:hypothetical protein
MPATYFGKWAGTNCVEQRPEIKSVCRSDCIPAAVYFLAEGHEDSSADEEGEAREESFASEDPNDHSSRASSDEDTPREDPEEDPCDVDQGEWPTAEPEEEKMLEKSAPRRGRVLANAAGNYAMLTPKLRTTDAFVYNMYNEGYLNSKIIFKWK